jgi:hypothetical protein
LESDEFQNYLELTNQENVDIFGKIQKNFSNVKIIENFLKQNKTGILEKLDQYKRTDYQQKIENFKNQISEQEIILFHRELFKFLFNVNFEMKVFSKIPSLQSTPTSNNFYYPTSWVTYTMVLITSMMTLPTNSPSKNLENHPISTDWTIQ